MEREQLSRLLRHAVDCYGADLPVPVPIPDRRAAVDSSLTRSRPITAEPTCVPHQSLQALKDEVLPCTKCKLAKTRNQVVFGEGDPKAAVFFIGEAPGANEDRTGRPFVGRAGQLLDRIIENAMGLHREDVFIGNVNKCRPPGTST